MKQLSTLLVRQLAQNMYCLLLAAIIIPSANATPNDPEQDAIDHIVIVEGIRAIQRDPNCAYAAKAMKLPHYPYREVTIHLSDSSRRDIELELLNPATKSKISSLGTAGRDVMQKLAPSGLDQKTLCGIWLGFAMTEYNRSSRKLGIQN